ncbi:transposase family protein, partial [Candidatus Fermentibacteria bacterium]|nr:transposase family protein [Candidatus Fermentibacteria bacterium]
EGEYDTHRCDRDRGFLCLPIEKHYQDALEKYHGRPTIALDTVIKYMGQDPLEDERREYPRGSFVYPEPFQVVALDTSYFKLFGQTYYLITVFELGGRLNLITRTFLHENTQAVVSVIEEFLTRFPGIQVAVIDRGTPYLNEEVKALLESHGRYRVVCSPETPTAKAAAERHFGTMKPAIRKVLESVFPRDPGWPAELMVKTIEAAAGMFVAMYHLVPQENIDGKSPAERASHFDPVRAAARQVALFEHGLNSEPGDQYARHIHQYFQFPWEERETVNALRVFSTRVLRQLVEEEKKAMGPPVPPSLHDPLGYLAARAREIRNKLWTAHFAKEWRKAEAERQQQIQERERTESDENPEAHVDGMLRALVTSVRNNHGVRTSARYMRELLQALARTMGGFFSHEISRLKRQVRDLTDSAHVVAQVVAVIDEIVAGLKVPDRPIPESAPP